MTGIPELNQVLSEAFAKLDVIIDYKDRSAQGVTFINSGMISMYKNYTMRPERGQHHRINPIIF